MGTGRRTALLCRGDRAWRSRLSSYPKLRLDPGWVQSLLVGRGLSAIRDTGPGGMVRMVARKAVE